MLFYDSIYIHMYYMIVKKLASFLRNYNFLYQKSEKKEERNAFVHSIRRAPRAEPSDEHERLESMNAIRLRFMY